jgi:putative DNA primase/helicase
MAIELNTGFKRPARREDYATKMAAVAPGEDGCPLWLGFLRRVTGDRNDDEKAQKRSAEMIAYLRRVAGYCLSGITREHVLFFLYGTGANGKGVFLNTLVGIWGDYATTASMETFTESRNDRHPTELAALRGARLVVAQETEEGRHWAEAKVKALTGGDRISARFMRQDFFEYTPQFKLMIAGNHKPSLRGVDEAIRRRFHLIPFDVTIPEAERDPELLEKLKKEWPGILQWAVGGCLEWQRDGLKPPAAVIDATAEYLAEQDSFTQWRDECCAVGAALFGVGDDLWRSWQSWAERAKERSGTRKGFAEAMKAHGYLLGNEKHRRGYEGIDLLSGAPSAGNRGPEPPVPSEEDYGAVLPEPPL